MIEWYKLGLDTLTFIVVLGGFILTLNQLGRWQEGSDMAAWTAVSQRWLELDHMFVQNPELRKYFYNGVPIRDDDPNYDKVMSAAFYVANFIDFAISTSDHIVNKYPNAVSIVQPDIWQNYLRATYLQSPVVRHILQEIPKGYSLGLKTLLSDVGKKG